MLVVVTWGWPLMVYQLRVWDELHARWVARVIISSAYFWRWEDNTISVQVIWSLLLMLVLVLRFCSWVSLRYLVLSYKYSISIFSCMILTSTMPFFGRYEGSIYLFWRFTRQICCVVVDINRKLFCLFICIECSPLLIFYFAIKMIDLSYYIWLGWNAWIDVWVIVVYFYQVFCSWLIEHNSSLLPWWALWIWRYLRHTYHALLLCHLSVCWYVIIVISHFIIYSN